MGSEPVNAEPGASDAVALLLSGPTNAFETAVHAHEQWKASFARAIRDRDIELQVETVRRDDQCLLGKWLHGDASRDVDNPAAFAMLRDVHAEFHKAAAGVLSLALAGKPRDALRAMDPGAPYGQWSAILTVALMRYVGSGGNGAE